MNDAYYIGPIIGAVAAIIVLFVKEYFNNRKLEKEKRRANFNALIDEYYSKEFLKIRRAADKYLSEN